MGTTRGTSRAAAAVAVAALLTAGCGGTAHAPDPADTTTSSTSATSSTTTTETSTSAGTTSAATAAPAGPSGDQATEFHALPVWWSGFELAPSSAAYTASDSTLAVKLQVKNTAYAELHLGSTGGAIGVRYAGQSYSANDGGPVLPQSTSVVTVTVRGLPADFTMNAAELVLGTDDQHQVKLPLNGFSPSAVAPTTLPTPADIRIAHTATTFKVTSARVIPARCDGNPVGIRYAPTTVDEVSLDVVGTLGSTSASRGGVAAEQAGATVGGVTSPAVPTMNEVLGVASPPLKRYHLCFPIPTGTHGAVTVGFRTRLVGETGFTPGRTTVTLP